VKFLSLAHEADADYLVTKDGRHLLPHTGLTSAQRIVQPVPFTYKPTPQPPATVRVSPRMAFTSSLFKSRRRT
jgi:hypothetical protein